MNLDKIFKYISLSSAMIIGLLIVGVFIQLLVNSFDIWKLGIWRFVSSCDFDTMNDIYGALPSIVGTLITSILALVIAVPIAFLASFMILECPKVIGDSLGIAIDLLAAIPSVIYGMWGLFVLVPFMQDHIQYFLVEILHFHKLPFVSEYYNGFGLFTASIILAIMILPYMSAIIRDVIKMTPPMLKESAYGIGCTKFETNKDIVLKFGIKGILGGIFIGLARALGETMAVLFVIGNMMELPSDIFAGATTIASTLANNFAEATGLQRSALFALGLILLVMSLIVQLGSYYFLRRIAKKNGEIK